VAKQSSAFDLKQQTGQTMAEYAVILTMITLAIFSALLLLNTSIGSRFINVANLIP
jgi:Flp pilus assembly pilin Flp